jgi:hypothetical protein
MTTFLLFFAALGLGLQAGARWPEAVSALNSAIVRGAKASALWLKSRRLRMAK